MKQKKFTISLKTKSQSILDAVKEHLSNNGYRAIVDKNHITVSEDEYYEVLTILNDQKLEYAISPH
mgnify:CR=1 FL=1